MWVVTEITKHRTNRGETGGLYFYRDSHQVEVDVIIEEPGKFTLVEAKAGQTVTGDMIKNRLAVEEILAKNARTEVIAAIGGNQGQRHTTKAIVPWSELREPLG